MKLIRQIALSTLLALGIFFGILYSSCSKDACKGVTCLNGASCSGGTCGPCDSGIGGTNCQTIYRQLYANPQSTYMGNAVISYTRFDSAALDSGYINHTDDSNTLAFSYGNDSTYSLMQLVWKDGANQVLSTPIYLTNNTSTGSTFNISATPVTMPASISGTGGTFVVSGSGSINTTNASLNIVAVSTDSTKPKIYITLGNCSKQ